MIQFQQMFQSPSRFLLRILKIMNLHRRDIKNLFLPWEQFEWFQWWDWKLKHSVSSLACFQAYLPFSVCRVLFVCRLCRSSPPPVASGGEVRNSELKLKVRHCPASDYFSSRASRVHYRSTVIYRRWSYITLCMSLAKLLVSRSAHRSLNGVWDPPWP